MKIKTYMLKDNWILVIAVLTISFWGCTKDYEMYNTDPNAATEAMLNKDNLQLGGFIRQMQQNVIPAGNNGTVEVNQYQLSNNLQGDIYSGYMGITNTWFGGRNNSTYALTPSWYGEMFLNSYSGVMSALGQIKTRNPSKDVLAIANIIKVASIQRTTDTYGPLPYLNFKLGAVISKYDSQESIYDSFFVDLDASIAVLTDFVTKYPNDKPLEKYDIIYNGDYRKWVQFANSLKLRLAMRIVYSAPQKAKKYAEEAVNHSIGTIGSNDANALLKTTGGVVIRNPLNVICYQYNDIRMGANMESFLKGYSDPRMSAWFNQGTNTSGVKGYYGIRNGISISNKSKYTPFSTLKIEVTSPIYWMVAAENYFLRAEGAIRGWNMAGTAKDLYEQGVRISFEQAGAGDASVYLANNTSTPAPYQDFVNQSNNVGAGHSNLSTITIKWSETEAFEAKLERIMTQKWISIYPNGQEAWSEFRRTGYPKVFPVVSNYSGGAIDSQKQIRRMPFPQSEYQNNSQGVASGTSLLGGLDNGGTKLWWDKK